MADPCRSNSSEMPSDWSRFMVEPWLMLGPPEKMLTVWERLQQPKIET